MRQEIFSSFLPLTTFSWSGTSAFSQPRWSILFVRMTTGFAEICDEFLAVDEEEEDDVDDGDNKHLMLFDISVCRESPMYISLRGGVSLFSPAASSNPSPSLEKGCSRHDVGIHDQARDSFIRRYSFGEISMALRSLLDVQLFGGWGEEERTQRPAL